MIITLHILFTRKKFKPKLEKFEILVISKTKWNKRNFKNLSNVKFLNNLNSKVLKYNPKIIFYSLSIFVPKKCLFVFEHSSDLPDSQFKIN